MLTRSETADSPAHAASRRAEVDRSTRPSAAVYSAPKRTVIVVPTYNESSNVRELVTRFFAHVDGVHLLVVDDASPDGTSELCKELQQSYPNLELLRREHDRGLGSAYRAGFARAMEDGFEVIGTMDADLSHDPAHLATMLELSRKTDVVIGSRYIEDGGTINWPLRRIMLSWVANKFASKLLRIPAHDVTSGFRLYTRAILQAVEPERVRTSGYSFIVELLYRAYQRGATIAESPIIFFDRTSGVSKLHRSEIYRGALNLLRLRFTR